MIEVKIECPCGQHYAFDVEPVNGQMPDAVSCPACGADGTAAANESIARQSPPPPAKPAVRLSVHIESNSMPAPAHSSHDARRLGIVNREQAEVEARAKISWGDSPEEVTKYLMLQGFSAVEARDLVQVMFKERLAAVRMNGIRKIMIGAGLICVSVIGFFVLGRVSIKLMAIAIFGGLYGAWLGINGILMIAAPKLESGDVAEQ